MITVILPTMWRGSEIKNELPKLQDSIYVNEIILINNDQYNTPNWFLEHNKTKILQIIPEKNIYVNPSWNLGVSISKNKVIMLHQDDMGFENYDFLKQIFVDIEENDSLIGCSSSCFSIQNSNELKLISFEGPRTYGFGCIMFFNKKFYKNIPEDFKLWKGDDLLIDRYRYNNKPVKVMDGLKIIGKISQTIDGSNEFDFKFQEGNLNLNNYLEQYRI